MPVGSRTNVLTRVGLPRSRPPVCGRVLWAALFVTLTPPAGRCMVSVEVANGGFEQVDAATSFATHWIRGFGTGTQATAELDDTVAHAGQRSLRITDATPTEAYKYAIVNTTWLDVLPRTTYVVRCHVRGRGVGKAFIGVACEGAGEHRQSLPVGDYDWREVTFRATVPAECHKMSIQFVADGVTEALWIDDVVLECATVQWTNVREVQYPRAFASWYPRTPGEVPRSLLTLDIRSADHDTRAMMTALQGIVNRQQPRLYLLHPTNPSDSDVQWLAEMRRHGYTDGEEMLPDPAAAVARFRDEIAGLVVWDPSLPGSANVAWMLAGLHNALPTSPAGIRKFELPIIEDLRGRWTRNVDAYRYVFERYWDRMCPHLLAWEYPLSNALQSRDVMVQHRVFQFWVSSYLDREPGADPPAEMAFLEELLARTPGNVPVMGWPMVGRKGIEEYTAVRLLSEFGKWVPGTGFTSNGSVHSAIRPSADVFRQPELHADNAPITVRPDRLYVSTNILDSGDAHWYWQLYQRRIWSDPARGAVATGYGMNVTLLDALPLVAQWYYEQRAPRDSFFALLYMNAPVYASRFADADRERIWREYVSWLDSYRRQLDMQGVELYSGGNGGPSASAELLRRFTRGMPGLSYVLTDMGRHIDTTPENAARVLDGVAVFRTLTNFRVWTEPEDVARRTMEDENAWLLGEITSHAPTQRPGFLSAMAISWNYSPAWMQDLRRRFPADYEPVSPDELARLLRAWDSSRAK
ncbi:MAG: hypothetical protein FJ276_07800 [Planctomycetes bacterium]|nr:hypothetical protein [Planctomycetota bacterium]